MIVWLSKLSLNFPTSTFGDQYGFPWLSFPPSCTQHAGISRNWIISNIQILTGRKN